MSSLCDAYGHLTPGRVFFFLLGQAALLCAFLNCLFSVQEGSPGNPQEHKHLQEDKNTNMKDARKDEIIYNLNFELTRNVCADHAELPLGLYTTVSQLESIPNANRDQ